VTASTYGVIDWVRASTSGELSSEAARDALRLRSEAWNPQLNALLPGDDTVHESTGDGPLATVPYVSKANIAVRDRLLDCASNILGDYRSPYHATATERLLAAGACWMGRSNMDEFAMGSSTEHSNAGPARNPWDLSRTPGGSSGGSAAAVAAGLVPFALGSDTGGSIRQPAGFCGVVGLKPTYGRVSRFGLVAFASSLDQIGPIARSVEDVALVYRVIAGHDPRDSTSLRNDVAATEEPIDTDISKLRVGVPWTLLEHGVSEEVRANFDASLQMLKDAGASVVDVDLPHARHGVAAYYVIAPAEASSNLARYDGICYGDRQVAEELDDMVRRTRTLGFGTEVKLRILMGAYVLSSGYYDQYYHKAQQLRTLLRREMRDALQHCDVIATPTSPTTAFPLGERTDDPLQMYAADLFTVLANLTGLPALAVPSGLDGDGLPFSLQFMGDALAESTLFSAGSALEHAVGFAEGHGRDLLAREAPA